MDIRFVSDLGLFWIILETFVCSFFLLLLFFLFYFILFFILKSLILTCVPKHEPPIFVWTHIFISFEFMPSSRTVGYMVTKCLTFWGTVKLTMPFYIQYQLCTRTESSALLPAFVFTFLFVHSHPMQSGTLL